MEDSEKKQRTLKPQIRSAGSAADDRELRERMARIEESILMRERVAQIEESIRTGERASQIEESIRTGERGQRENGASGREALRHSAQKEQAKKENGKKRGGMKLLEGLFRLIREKK